MLLLFSLMFLSLLPGQKFVQARGRGNIPKKRAKTCNYDPSICSVTEDCVVTSEVKIILKNIFINELSWKTFGLLVSE